MSRLLSVNVGLPRDIEWQGKTVHTAVWKTPVHGRRMTRRLNIDGDGQGDLAGHGGEHRAVFVYQIDSYRYWQNQLNRDDFIYGQFGENFTVEGLADTEVCIGDHYRIGDAVFEVTQPRVTCYRVGIRMNEPQMAALLVSHGRPGFYFRVLEEGEVGAGDEIVKLQTGPEQVTITEINALLYLPGHPASGLERALRIPTLSAGWRTSLAALLDRDRKRSGTTGNPGLGPPIGPPPAWQGFRSFRVSRKLLESSNVTSLVLEPADGEPLTAAPAGQFIVLRLRPRPNESALLRSYSLSGAPSKERYRISVKREPQGAAGAYIDTRVQTGDILDVSAPRGSFTLRQGERPVVLVSAGIGATPVLAMLHALAAGQSRRAIWWIHGARNSGEHPFAAEVSELLKTLPGSRSHIRYSAPKPTDRPTVDFDKVGRLGVPVFEEIGVPPDADFYICGPAAFMSGLVDGLAGWGVARDRLHTENFGSGQSKTPGIAAVSRRPPHSPAESAEVGPLVSFTRSNLAVHWGSAFHSLLELAEACDVPVRWACRTGVCHNCETGLISGSVIYRPDPVEPPAAGNLLICCSQPQTDIALDL
jgi:ferredoxin-NADP reductase/MOSC domain-containing protein YiiM/ferredoxin